ncbi:GNAT family N-acetyltransferase [Desertihabitans brevis]|uniref:GNAT family N-acetyltransferase n=1 Tax=Desertihabitans brevis TaxID=2268447 RepID=A0A367YZC0_9ACTN|nr:GNAT family N-acetyltransferase [Desertihabitans brevis]RCK70849.1 GNAT family N-acetyltransferase [Desertihabitans brevis]
MAGHVRVLTDSDVPDVIRLLTEDPVVNVFVAARVRSGGVDEFTLGCPMWGWEVGERLRALLHVGSNLVPVQADPQAVDGFVEHLGRTRRCSSIVGPAEVVLALWQGLSQRWGDAWSQVRELRADQPLLVMDTDPTGAEDERVQRITEEHWEAYSDASARMYTEEVGVPPAPQNPLSYRMHVLGLIKAGRAFGIVEDGRVLYKADLGSVAGGVSQVQGVWVDPELRGRGLAAPAMARTVRLAREETPTVSLYVNDFNERARRTYQRVGFRQVGTFATVLY